MIKALLQNEITQEEVLHNYRANITCLRLPCKINGFVYKYKDINNIYVNDGLSLYNKKKTILHELAHIELNHLHCDRECLNFNFKELDDEADEYIRRINNEQ